MQLQILSTMRTNNFTDQRIIQKIGSLWEENSEAVKACFNLQQAVFIVYHNYVADYRGDYAVSLCIEAKGQADFDTDSCQWLYYTVDQTKEMGILETWKKIWHAEDENQLKRQYAFDYEQYKADGSVVIGIGTVA